MVFPTCVGVYRQIVRFGIGDSSFPHMRGGVPDRIKARSKREMFSPHAWGCTVSVARIVQDEMVFPTCVGVYRCGPKCGVARNRFPHMRGGVPNARPGTLRSTRFPHMRGGVPPLAAIWHSSIRFPHMRGGVPLDSESTRTVGMFSPHAWGCTESPLIKIGATGVFPTCVGVYRVRHHRSDHTGSFPHMRGGVPEAPAGRVRRMSFSPHAWGCTGHSGPKPAGRHVFPTCVGVYRSAWRSTLRSTRFPHMRGGVPPLAAICAFFHTFSPHAWGCTVRL